METTGYYLLGSDLTGGSVLDNAIKNQLKDIKQDINMNNHKIVNLGYPEENSDAANKQYVLDTFVAQGDAG